jgi:molecular chaperone HscA
VRVRVTFTVDADGILSVSAYETSTGLQQSIEVKPSYGLSEEALLKMIEESHLHAKPDIEERLLREARVEAETLAQTVDDLLKDSGELLEGEEDLEITHALEELKSVLKSSSREEIASKVHDLKRIKEPLETRYRDKAITDLLKGRDPLKI